MGKKSLLKSTSKKGSKKKAVTKEKTDSAVDETAAAGKKASAKKPAAKKATAKKAPAKKASPKSKKAPAKAAKKLSPKELLHLKFDEWKPAKLFSSPSKSGADSPFAAPAPFSGRSSEEQERISKLLFNQYDIHEILAAGKKATEAKAKAEAEAKAKAEAEAKAKAEAEAKAKAEAEAKAKAEAEAKAKAEAEAKAKAEAEAKAKAEAEAKAKAEAEAKAKAEAEAKAKAKAKIAEETPEPVVLPEPNVEESDSMRKALITVVVSLAIILTPIIIASFMNASKYYLQPTDGAVEIWKGSFAPLGKSKLMTLPGAVAPEQIKEEYCKSEVFPLIFNYYLEKSDALLKVAGMPDFTSIKKDLDTAMAHATNKSLREIIYNRYTTIDLMTLLYKADVAAGKQTEDGLEEAAEYLEEAALLDLDEPEAEMIAKKLAELRAAIESGAAVEVVVPETPEVEVPAPEADTSH